MAAQQKLFDEKLVPPTLEQCKLEAAKAGMPEIEGEQFWYYWDSVNWFRSKGRKLVRWRSALALWRNNWRMRQPRTIEDTVGAEIRRDGQRELNGFKKKDPFIPTPFKNPQRIPLQ